MEQLAPNSILDANSCPDEQIVARVLGGEAQLFEVIVRRHARKLYRVAISVVRNDSDAEDVVQDTFLSAYQHLAQFAGRASLITWLCRIALYRALADVRFRHREISLEDEEAQQVPALTHCGPTPEQAVCAREAARVLHSAIRSLPESYRRVLVMRDVDEVDTATTARQLGITATNVKVRLHRARTMLRRESALALTSRSAAHLQAKIQHDSDNAHAS